jgi:diguanylate cyclase
MKPALGSSLKIRIALVAGLLFLAGIIGVSLVVSSIQHREMQAMLSGQQLAAANYISREISGKLTLRLESLKRVASNVPPALLNDSAALQIWLDDRRAIHTLFPTGLMVVPPDGGPTLADTPRLATRPKSFTDRDWFIGVKASGKPYISKPLIARATGQPALVIAVPILDQQQRLQGILAGVTPLTTPGFLDQIREARPGSNGSYQLIATQSRLFVLGSNAQEAATELPASGSDPLIDAALSGEPGIRTIGNAQGEDELAAIVDVPPANWRLLARQPARDAFEPVRNTLTNTWLLTGLLSFPIIALLLLALNRLLRPLEKLADDLRGMAEGTRPMHPVELGRDDEVGRVAHELQSLAAKTAGTGAFSGRNCPSRHPDPATEPSGHQ